MPVRNINISTYIIWCIHSFAKKFPLATPLLKSHKSRYLLDSLNYQNQTCNGILLLT